MENQIKAVLKVGDDSQKFSVRTWKVLTYKAKSFEPRMVERASDSMIFAIGDRVTNGTKMKGLIKSFEFDESLDGDIFVLTDWSDVGMNLESLSHVKEEKKLASSNILPSQFQPGSFCGVRFGDNAPIFGGQIVKVSFTLGKVLYDVEIGVGKDQVTRLHSIDSTFVIPSGVGIIVN